MNEIAVIVPVLNRPQNAQPLADSLREATSAPYRLVFVCSWGDHDQIAASARTGAYTVPIDGYPGNGDYARKINYAYRDTAEPYLLLAADDLVFHSGWDTAALALAHRGYGVVGTNDMGNGMVMRGEHATHPLVSRAYADACGTIDECGKILHEGYRHNCVDVELVETAKARGAWAFAHDARIEHLHPLWHKAADDATYRLGRSGYADDQRLLEQRRQLWQQTVVAA